MANTYTLISSNVLGSNTASVTFSSIPSTYTDLVLRASTRTSYTADAYPRDTFIRFNGDSATNYSVTRLGAQTGSAFSGRTSSASQGIIFEENTNAAASTANTFSETEVYIPNYLSTSNRAFSNFGVSENNDNTYPIIGATALLYRGGSAISSIFLSPQGGTANFLTGSSFYLYGIKNS